LDCGYYYLDNGLEEYGYEAGIEETYPAEKQSLSNSEPYVVTTNCAPAMRLGSIIEPEVVRPSPQGSNTLQALWHLSLIQSQILPIHDSYLFSSRLGGYGQELPATVEEGPNTRENRGPRKAKEAIQVTPTSFYDETSIWQLCTMSSRPL
jgi:hypothetical protein